MVRIFLVLARDLVGRVEAGWRVTSKHDRRVAVAVRHPLLALHRVFNHGHSLRFNLNHPFNRSIIHQPLTHYYTPLCAF